jgi:hypothetical protein
MTLAVHTEGSRSFVQEVVDVGHARDLVNLLEHHEQWALVEAADDAGGRPRAAGRPRPTLAVPRGDTKRAGAADQRQRSCTQESAERVGEELIAVRQFGDAQGSAVASMRLNTGGTPLVAGGIAFGSGVLLGWAVRARDMVGHLCEPVQQRVWP